jgi:ABC-type phosphate transport system substrate-binding protein
MKIISIRTFALLAACALICARGAAAPVLIGNKTVAAEKLDAATIKSIFLGKKVAWDGAGRITLAVLKGGPVAEEYFKSAVEMTVSAFNNHWRRLAMTGGGTAPKSFEKEEELRKFVAETPGAVGFVDSANADNSVVVLKPAS